MRILKDDVFSRRPLRQALVSRRGVSLFILIFVSLGLLALSRIGHPAVQNTRQALAEFVSPGLQAIGLPLAPIRQLASKIASYTTAAEEINTLRDEVQKLKGWEARAHELERRLADLGALARVVDEPGIDFITGRVIADAKGPFARSVLLNAGRELGLKGGYPVVSGDGLIGRVIETGARSARVLLLTDLNSRIPVLIGSGGTRGVLIGDNGARPRLAHLPEHAQTSKGDEVVTSGVGGLFPRGLRIGEVVEEAGVLRVAPHARLDDLDHVSVLFYQSPALELASEEPRKPAISPADKRGNARRSKPVNPGTGE